MARRLPLALCLALLTILGGARAPAQERPEEPAEPFDSGLVERAGIALTILDVAVEDAEGNPVRGLTAEDFLVRLDGREWPVYSVDELCPCRSLATPAGTERSSGPAPDASPASEGGAPGPAPEPPPAYEPPRFVLYFDSSQLQVDGRIHAVRAAGTWIRETMRPDDQAMVVVFASQSGLRELCPFTSDRKRLLAAVDRVLADPEYLDPFPSLFVARIEQCLRCIADCAAAKVCPDCVKCCSSDCRTNARDELMHGRRALHALSAFLARLERIPGRKALLLFHQNGVLFPSRFYPSREVGDQLSQLDGVAADATLARTAIYPAFSGATARPEDALADQAVTFGANLADFTGGAYNRGNVDLASLLDQAARGCACVYRVALRPPDDYKNRVFRAEVRVRDLDAPHHYRLRFLDEADRWWRNARAVLGAPESASDVAVRAALVPVGFSADGWDLAVQVSIETASLLEVPSAAGGRTDWEIGALLTRDSGRKNWEMLARSRAVAGEEAAGASAAVVHERIFSSLRPGRYRLAAFARDRVANAFGGAEAELTLPEPGPGGIIGPILMRADAAFVKSVLPLLEERTATDRSTEIRTGRSPIRTASVPKGVRLDALAWICPGKGSPGPPAVLRFVSGGGVPLFRFDTEPRPADGACYSLDDRIETSALEAGTYAYTVRWSPTGDAQPVEESVAWAVPGEPAPQP